jgi:hypothetical protein
LYPPNRETGSGRFAGLNLSLLACNTSSIPRELSAPVIEPTPGAIRSCQQSRSTNEVQHGHGRIERYLFLHRGEQIVAIFTRAGIFIPTVPLLIEIALFSIYYSSALLLKIADRLSLNWTRERSADIREFALSESERGEKRVSFRELGRQKPE